MSKKWLDSDQEIDRIQNSNNYISVELGIITVDPTEIIGLSRKLEENDLIYLRNKIINMGWKDINPRGISLVLRPEGGYVVGSGGNHRAIISNELGIKEITAEVIAYIDKSKMTDEEKEHIRLEEEKISELNRSIRQYKGDEKRYRLIEEIAALEFALEEYKKGIYYRT
ncbi:hypothetical protein MKZ15_06190 [Paenibacillus sp. FSL R7-0216]|uniref:hypothetical protein n=1 Tax=Paenibacillus sp. FSL R7-0216 TaxID=2921677 RepID=UPI0030DA9EB4